MITYFQMTYVIGNETTRYDVVALLGPTTSRKAVMVAALMSLFKIPTLGIFATSVELSDKSRFEYFLRLVPHDE